MARKTRRSSQMSLSSNHGGAASKVWAGYMGVGVLCAALGSGGTYLALRPALSQATASRAVTAQAARDLGNAYEDRQQWPQAIAAYTQAITEGLDNPDIRTDLGVAYFRSNQPKQALEQYQTAQRQNPQHENSLYNQGSVYALSGDSARAIALWQQYLQRFPQGQHAAEARTLIAEVQAHGIAR